MFADLVLLALLPGVVVGIVSGTLIWWAASAVDRAVGLLRGVR